MTRLATVDSLARLLAAVGLAFGFVALWHGTAFDERVSTQRYWDDGTRGGLILILACVSTAALVAGTILRRRSLDLVEIAAGATLFGLYLFYPLTARQLGSASWLGLCTGLVPIAGLLTVSVRASRGRPSPFVAAAALIAVVGAVVVVVGVFLELFTSGALAGSTYWSFGAVGHRPGIVLLVLAVVSVALLAGTLAGEAIPYGAPVAFAGATAGLGIFLPVWFAFRAFDGLRAGAWVAAVGGLALLIGAAVVVATRLPRD
jgi:hypothetical protein